MESNVPEWRQTKLTDLHRGQTAHSISPPLHIVRPGEDRIVRIGRRHISLELLAEIWRMYFDGSSTRALARHLLTKGISCSHVTIWKWMLTLSHLLYEYTIRLRPAVGNTWYADEMKVGRSWLVSVRDKATHYILATGVIFSRSAKRLRVILETAHKIAGKCPKKLKTDDCPGYRRASREVFHNDKIHEPMPKDEPGGRAHTNFIEGSQRHPRARIHLMTSFHGTVEEAQDIAEGYFVHHNFVAISPAAGNKTPAEVSAIPPLGDNPALTLLWNAVGESSLIPLRRHTPYRRRIIRLTRWIPIMPKLTSYLPRRRRGVRINSKPRDSDICRWCVK